MGCPRLLVLATLVAGCVVGLAQTPNYNLGRTPTPEEMREMDIGVTRDGKGLPAGSGDAIKGARVYVEKGCLACHGEEGRGGLAPQLVEGPPNPKARKSEFPVRVLATDTPFPTVIWDFIHRAMPLQQAGTLTPDEVYALTAYLLFKNNIIKEDEVMNAQTLVKVKMPNADKFVPPQVSEYKAGARMRRPWVK
jgi:cytochrome c